MICTALRDVMTIASQWIKKFDLSKQVEFFVLWVQFRYLPKMATIMAIIMAIIKYFSDMLSCDSVILLPYGNNDIETLRFQ